jgi:Domain of unknown function (DUF5666)
MRFKSLTALALAAGALVVAAPAQAAPKAQRATVLSVDRAHHALRVVRKGKAATLHYKGKLKKNVAFGAKVSFVLKRRLATKVRYVGRARAIKVHGLVVKSRGGLGIRLGDGKLLRLGTPSARRTSGISITLVGLKPGQQVDVTITFAGGDVNVLIQIGDGDASLCDNPSCRATFDGVVDTVGDDAFTLALGDAGAVSVAASQEILDQIEEGDPVHVVARQSREDGSYTATSVELTDDQGGDDPGADDPCADGSCDVSADGTVAAIDFDAGTFTLHADSGDTVFVAPDDLLGTLQVGESVHVDATRDPDTGDLIVADVEPADGAPSVDGCQDGACDVHAEGGVTAIDAAAGTFTVHAGDGVADQVFEAADDIVAALRVGERVAVDGFESPQDGTLLALAVTELAPPHH